MTFTARLPAILVVLLLLALAAPPAGATDCRDSREPTFTVRLPPAPEYASDPSLAPAEIEIPKGRPIYALIVHGYTQNGSFDQLLCYNFAKRLMEDGAYVHYAWWNNLCAEYTAGPLHDPTSNPGHLGLFGYIGASNPDLLNKALPPEDYQFQSDAMAFLTAIRANNPSAMIILVGHSMGGAAVARLATETEVVIDILAPLDPVENRSRPLGNLWDYYYSFTRWRIAHMELESVPPVNPVERVFGTNVINLYHRYQHEGVPPADNMAVEHFGHTVPPGGSSSQASVATCDDLDPGTDPGGYQDRCWFVDGHGEIVGFRGLVGDQSVPMGLQAQGGWPTGRTPEDACMRRRLLMEMPHADYRNDWKYRPTNPDLCLVSPGLIELYETMNRPPDADAGGDRTVSLSSPGGVTLDGSASTDPDDDVLTCKWEGMDWERSGEVVSINPGLGRHAITLTVKDPSGHIDIDSFVLTVTDGRSDEALPVTRIVGANPNPFNASIRVFFELADQQKVSLQIFDVQGHFVRTLEEGTFEPGRHDRVWDGYDDAGRVASSGTYFVRMRAGNRVENYKILLLK